MKMEENRPLPFVNIEKTINRTSRTWHTKHKSTGSHHHPDSDF